MSSFTKTAKAFHNRQKIIAFTGNFQAGGAASLRAGSTRLAKKLTHFKKKSLTNENRSDIFVINITFLFLLNLNPPAPVYNVTPGIPDENFTLNNNQPILLDSARDQLKVIGFRRKGVEIGRR